MPLIVKDGNNASQSMPNAGIDNTTFYIVDATITASATSATDVYQFKGAAGYVARIRRMKFMNLATVAAGAFAANSTLFHIIRRSTAGTTGTWTALNTSTTYGQAHAGATSNIAVNVAGNTAFTAGSLVGNIDRGYLPTPLASKTDALNMTNPVLEFTWGTRGNYPLDVVGTSDYVVVNLAGVTPIATVVAVLEWEEATA